MNKPGSVYSVGYAVAKGWLPQESIPSPQEMAQAIRGLFDAMPIHLLHDQRVLDAVKRASALIKRVRE
jgi:hypothetical protein